MIKILKISLFSLLISTQTLGLETIKHPTCKVHMHKFDVEHSYDGRLQNDLKKALEDKGYDVTDLGLDRRIPNKDFHMVFKRTLLKGIYKPCLIEVIIREAKGKTAVETDPIIYKKSSLRKFPRQTFKGKERCKMALKDLFFSINLCKKY